MPEEKKSERCPHCGQTQIPSLLIRTHCRKCGRPLKGARRTWQEPEIVIHRPRPSA